MAGGNARAPRVCSLSAARIVEGGDAVGDRAVGRIVYIGRWPRRLPGTAGTLRGPWTGQPHGSRGTAYSPDTVLLLPGSLAAGDPSCSDRTAPFLQTPAQRRRTVSSTPSPPAAAPAWSRHSKKRVACARQARGALGNHSPTRSRPAASAARYSAISAVTSGSLVRTYAAATPAAAAVPTKSLVQFESVAMLFYVCFVGGVELSGGSAGPTRGRLARNPESHWTKNNA